MIIKTLSSATRGQMAVVGATMVVLLLVMTPHPARAAEQSSTQETALQVTGWVATIPYGALKMAYALGGGVVGGLAWGLTGGNTTVAQSVWVPSMTGDYIVRPENLTGEKPLHFVGGRPKP